MIRSRLVVLFVLAVLPVLSAPAMANFCTIDQVPGATLLLPYFQVDLSSSTGVDTLFSINNASAAPEVVHVTLWTDESIPTIDFDIFLTGYDVQTINLRDIFNGNLPVTAVADIDANDTISPNYDHPVQYGTWDSASGQFPGCNNLQPLGSPALSSTYVALIQQAHTGQAVDFYGGNCAAQDFGDNIARGYITADVVTDCNLLFPGDPAYQSTYLVTGAAANVIWGDYFYVDPANNFAQGEDLVSIESDSQLAVPGNFTFYGRYNAWTGLDAREPLATTFATRYLEQSGPFDGTQLAVWRDSLDTYTNDANGFTCGSAAEWYPLSQDQVVAFDEQENATELCNKQVSSNVSPPPPVERQYCFPAETQLLDVQTGNGIADAINPPYDFGWLFLNLNQPVYSGTTITGYNLAQAWVTTIMHASGLYSVGMNAIQLDTACDYFGLAASWTSFGQYPDPSQKIGL